MNEHAQIGDVIRVSIGYLEVIDKELAVAAVNIVNVDNDAILRQ